VASGISLKGRNHAGEPVARSIELLASPPGTGLFVRGLTVEKWMQFSGSAFTDSYDSHDSTKSTNGQYVLAKRQEHGDVASNYEIKSSSRAN